MWQTSCILLGFECQRVAYLFVINVIMVYFVSECKIFKFCPPPPPSLTPSTHDPVFSDKRWGMGEGGGGVAIPLNPPLRMLNRAHQPFQALCTVSWDLYHLQLMVCHDQPWRLALLHEPKRKKEGNNINYYGTAIFWVGETSGAWTWFSGHFDESDLTNAVRYMCVQSVNTVNSQ